jgi:peptidoglycan lytic transglycosylase
MLTFTKSAPGKLTRSRTALAVFAATLFAGGTATEASAKSRHHHHAYHHHHAHYAGNGSQPASGTFSRSTPDSSWRNTNAVVVPSSGSGRSFSGMASYYGNESGSRTASGQRFDQNALTCAHRSLPFGTKLRVTHGDRSVVVTVNDRGPFVHGRVLDLSTAAARAVGITGAGVGHVTAEVIS